MNSLTVYGHRDKAHRAMDSTPAALQMCKMTKRRPQWFKVRPEISPRRAAPLSSRLGCWRVDDQEGRERDIQKDRGQNPESSRSGLRACLDEHVPAGTGKCFAG